MKSFLNDLLDQKLGRLALFATARGLFLDAGNAMQCKTASPQAHRLRATTKHACDFRVSQPI